MRRSRLRPPTVTTARQFQLVATVTGPDPDRALTLSVILTVALGSLCASFMNAASNAINQITDLEIDRVNKPGRPLVTGALSLREGWMFTWVFYALALVPTWAVVVFPHTTLAAKIGAPLPWHETFYIYLAGMVFTLIYSVPSWGRTKALGMWANWTIAIPRGCLLKVAGWAMVARVGHWEPWALGSIFMLFLVGAASTKDFADIEGDRAGGCHTLPIDYGVKMATWIMAPFFVLIVIFANPDGPMAVGMTLFPTTSFLTVLIRWGLTTIPAWQLALSWLLLVASAAGSVELSEEKYDLLTQPRWHGPQ